MATGLNVVVDNKAPVWILGGLTHGVKLRRRPHGLADRLEALPAPGIMAP